MTRLRISLRGSEDLVVDVDEQAPLVLSYRAARTAFDEAFDPSPTLLPLSLFEVIGLEVLEVPAPVPPQYADVRAAPVEPAEKLPLEELLRRPPPGGRAKPRRSS